jgi:copper resistance protein C
MRLRRLGNRRRSTNDYVRVWWNGIRLRLSARRLAAATAAGILAVLVAPAAPVWAHSALLSTSPAEGAVLTAPIGEVALTFNEVVKQRFSTIVVNGPNDGAYSNGSLQVIDTVAHQPVWPLHSGAYRVAWRIISADGHPVSGEFSFQVALPPGLEPTADPPPVAQDRASAGSTSGGWWWLAVGVVAVGVVLGLVFLGRGRPVRGR